MPTFRSPQYSKLPHPETGAIEPCYTFVIEHSESEEKLSCIADEESQLHVNMVASLVENALGWWSEWLSSFLTSSSTFFSKPYTVLHLRKITKHELKGTVPSMFPCNVILLPKTIQIRGGFFWVHWEYIATPITIDIPDMIEDMPEEKTLPVSNEVEELNGEDVPVDPNATEESMMLDTPSKIYDKQKVKEARLKAKIAMYRAQQQMNRFYEKYGAEVTDSDTETDTGDELSDEEAVQL